LSVAGERKRIYGQDFTSNGEDAVKYCMRIICVVEMLIWHERKEFFDEHVENCGARYCDGAKGFLENFFFLKRDKDLV